VDFATKVATVTMKPGVDLTADAVTKAFEGSSYSLDGTPKRAADSPS